MAYDGFLTGSGLKQPGYTALHEPFTRAWSSPQPGQLALTPALRRSFGRGLLGPLRRWHDAPFFLACRRRARGPGVPRTAAWHEDARLHSRQMRQTSGPLIQDE